MTVHVMTLEYTNDDDGVHLLCKCGWEASLGMSPSPEAAMEAATIHRESRQQDDGGAYAIKGRREGRQGCWLIDAETAIALIEEVEGDEVHNFMGTGVFIGCHWSKQRAVEFFKTEVLRIALLFDPNINMRHHLVAINDENRWAFDVGEIEESRMMEDCHADH